MKHLVVNVEGRKYGLVDGMQVAARHSSRNERGQLEELRAQVDFLAGMIGVLVYPLLKHNLISMNDLEQVLPFDVKIEETEIEEEV